MAISALVGELPPVRVELADLEPRRVALAVPPGSNLEAQLAQNEFSMLAGVQQLRSELEAGGMPLPSLLLLRGTVETAVAQLLLLRDVPGLERVPIICVLGDGRRDDLRACERASAFACLREPVSAQALASAINLGLMGGSTRASLAPPQDSSSLVREMELRLCSPKQVEAVVSALSALCPEPMRQGLGLAELVMNAIEHGNLEISGAHKAQLLLRGGFEEEVARRLRDPRFAGREARVRLTRYPDHVELVVEDAGPGFDWRNQLEKVIDFEAPCGRGLRLAQQLAFDSLEYLGRGNVAIARVRSEVRGRGVLVGISDWERRSLEMRTERFLEQGSEVEFFTGALRLCLELSGSTRGLIGYLDNFGLLVVPAHCSEDAPPSDGKHLSLGRDAWPASWTQTLVGGSALVSGEGLSLELMGGGPRPEPTLAVPIVQGGKVLGFVLLSGAPNSYTGLDAERIEIALGRLAAVFIAQVEASLAWSARQRLEEGTVLAQHEQNAAAHMMQCLRGESRVDPDVRQFSAAKEIFNGDLLLSERLPDGRLRVMLADFVGHGLAAAIGGLPLSYIFHATARKEVALPEVLATMNDALRGFLPGGHFCGAILLDLDSRQGRVDFWNGGMPPSLLWRPGSAELSLLPSEHLPLGVVSSSELGVEPSSLPVTGGDQLLVMSDGVTEFEGATGELFGLGRIERALRDAPAQDPYDSIVNALNDFREILNQANDDASLIRIHVGV